MKIIGPEHDLGQNWKDRFGLSRDEVIGTLLRGEWYDRLGSQAVLAIYELRDEAFGLAFDFHKSEEDLKAVRASFRGRIDMSDARSFQADPMAAQFQILFDYMNRLQDVTLRHVQCRGCQYQGFGDGLTGAVAGATTAVGASRILVKAGAHGSWYWPRRGARFQDKNVFAVLGDKAIETEAVRKDWAESDRQEFRRVFVEQDLLGLNKLVSRDDLYVLLRGMVIPLHRHLLEGKPVGICVLDLDHGWTQMELLKRTGFDAVLEKKYGQYTAPERPATGLPLVTTSAPAS